MLSGDSRPDSIHDDAAVGAVAKVMPEPFVARDVLGADVRVALKNDSYQPFTVASDDRSAQARLVKAHKIGFEEVVLSDRAWHRRPGKLRDEVAPVVSFEASPLWLKSARNVPAGLLAAKAWTCPHQSARAKPLPPVATSARQGHGVCDKSTELQVPPASTVPDEHHMNLPTFQPGTPYTREAWGERK